MSVIVLSWASAGLRLILWAAVCWAIVTGLDYLNADPFSRDKRRLSRSPMAIAVYRGIRWGSVLIGSAIILS